MDINQLRKKIKEEKNENLIAEFEIGERKYVKTFKKEKIGVSYQFYEIENDKVIDIIDEKIFKYLEKNYNVNQTVVYKK